ncbi:MAG: hypothetical protein J3R72DRAFT_174302 [Linnemannia gamsii]|nr:MAG: hypothetical protein J3R72DRAFT_174302 [Linnemannia gamsii]
MMLWSPLLVFLLQSLCFSFQCYAQVIFCTNTCFDPICFGTDILCGSYINHGAVGASSLSTFGATGTCYIASEGFSPKTSPHCCAKSARTAYTPYNGASCPSVQGSDDLD